ISYLSVVYSFFFFLLIRPPPCSTLFPYTTLFRSFATEGFPFHRTLQRAGPSASGSSPSRCESRQCRQVPRSGGAGLHPFDVLQRSEEHTSELQSLAYLVCRLLLEKKNKNHKLHTY